MNVREDGICCRREFLNDFAERPLNLLDGLRSSFHTVFFKEGPEQESDPFDSFLFCKMLGTKL